MNKKIITLLLTLVMLVSLVACQDKDQEVTYEKYKDTFYDTFDTITQVVAYTETEEEFKEYMEIMHNRFLELHKLFDKYNDYEGINNIKTINDNAGKSPVKVDREIIDMLLFSKHWYEKAGEETNIAFGPVIEVWTKHREKAELDPENASMPDMDELKEAAKHTDIDKVIIDEEAGTVFLEDEEMSLDVGAVAKGYATELVAREIEEAGLKSCLISAGGNIRGIGKPLDGERERWGIGLQNPDEDLIPTGRLLDTVYINDMSVVSSGDYQRYYFVGDERMHHIIDPKTLMPGRYYRAVTIVTPDSGLADFLSTSLFLLPYEESFRLAESLEDVEVLWVFPDGEIKATEGMEKIMNSMGASGANKD